MRAAALTIALVLIASTQSACTTTRVNPESQVTDFRRLSSAEWTAFANEMVNSLAMSGIIDDFPTDDTGRVIVAIGDFRNQTDNPYFTRDRDVMYNRIEDAMVRSRRIGINRDVAGTGGSRDALLRDIQDLMNSPDYDPQTMQLGSGAPIPSLILTGQIVAITTREGRTTQIDYQVNCELVDVRRRYAVWSDSFDLTKQRTRGLFGS